jgi:hypothetical protein
MGSRLGKLRNLVEFPEVTGASFAVLPPIRVPIRPVWTLRARRLAALDGTAQQLDFGRPCVEGDSPLLEAGPREYEEPPQLVLIHISDGFEHVAINWHDALSRGAVYKRKLRWAFASVG